MSQLNFDNLAGLFVPKSSADRLASADDASRDPDDSFRDQLQRAQRTSGDDSGDRDQHDPPDTTARQPSDRPGTHESTRRKPDAADDSGTEQPSTTDRDRFEGVPDADESEGTLEEDASGVIEPAVGAIVVETDGLARVALPVALDVEESIVEVAPTAGIVLLVETLDADGEPTDDVTQGIVVEPLTEPTVVQASDPTEAIAAGGSSSENPTPDATSTETPLDALAPVEPLVSSDASEAAILHAPSSGRDRTASAEASVELDAVDGQPNQDRASAALDDETGLVSDSPMAVDEKAGSSEAATEQASSVAGSTEGAGSTGRTDDGSQRGRRRPRTAREEPGPTERVAGAVGETVRADEIARIDRTALGGGAEEASVRPDLAESTSATSSNPTPTAASDAIPPGTNQPTGIGVPHSEGVSPITTSASIADGPTDTPSTRTAPTIDRARFVQRVARAFESLGNRGGAIRMRLHPPELGSVHLEMTVRGGAMVARLETETTAARTALLDNLPALRERLAGQEIRVERFEVDVQDRSSGGSPHTPGDGTEGGNQRQPPRQSPGGSSVPELTLEDTRPPGRVDGGATFDAMA